MTSEWWQRVYELFNEALPLEATERQQLLETRCGSDSKLRTEIERLLARDAEAEREDFLSPPLDTARDEFMFSMPQSIRIHCPNCGNGIELVDFMSASQVECPSCHSTVTLKDPAAFLGQAAGKEQDRPLHTG